MASALSMVLTRGSESKFEHNYVGGAKADFKVHFPRPYKILAILQRTSLFHYISHLIKEMSKQKHLGVCNLLCIAHTLPMLYIRTEHTALMSCAWTVTTVCVSISLARQAACYGLVLKVFGLSQVALIGRFARNL